MEVTLLCEVDIFNGVEKWKNVTYRIDWFSEGTSLKREEICQGDGEPCQSVANGKVHSTLEPSKYKIGQWVSLYNIMFFFCFFFFSEKCHSLYLLILC